MRTTNQMTTITKVMFSTLSLGDRTATPASATEMGYDEAYVFVTRADELAKSTSHPVYPLHKLRSFHVSIVQNGDTNSTNGVGLLHASGAEPQHCLTSEENLLQNSWKADFERFLDN